MVMQLCLFCLLWSSTAEPVNLLDSYLSFLRHVHAQLQK